MAASKPLFQAESNLIVIHGQTDGTLPYIFLWSTGGTDSTITALCANNYEITVTDSSGCLSFGSVSLTEPAPMVLVMGSTHDYGSGNGTASVAVIGGVSPYAYLWNDSDAQTSATATDLVGGLYTVIVTDNAGCSESDTVTVILLAIDEISHAVEVKLYPNPVRDELYLKVTGLTSDMTFSILALDGRVISEGIVEHSTSEVIYSVDMKSYPKGIYLVRMIYKDKVITERIIIQ
ncbi:MAG: T9SS type A sorting domain-containing protein [Bacteroidia bacterium]|nr:T9SS type A sorting domain-containing protein [Bacteroidia bacterium]